MDRTGGVGSRPVAEPSTIEEAADFDRGALSSAGYGEHHHVNGVASRSFLLVLLAKDILDYKHCGSGGGSAMNRAEDRHATAVIPVVQHVHQQVGIRRGQRIDEEVTRARSEPLVLNIEGVDDGREVKQHALRAGRRVKYCPQQEPAATPDVGIVPKRLKSKASRTPAISTLALALIACAKI